MWISPLIWGFVFNHTVANGYLEILRILWNKFRDNENSETIKQGLYIHAFI